VHCPYCRNTDTRVLDSRVADDGGAIRRRRTCPSLREALHHRRADAADRAQALRRDRAVQPRQGDRGVRKACKGRPVTEDDLACLGQAVEDALRSSGWAEVPANEVGLAILGPLRELDEVAYLRFASVYRAFESADDFEAEIAVLAPSAHRPHRAKGELDELASRSASPRRADLRPPGHGVGKLRGRAHQTRSGATPAPRVRPARQQRQNSA
jgi:transcriptional repressor NrdR